MPIARLPLDTSRYLRDTQHLSPLRHGVYLLALMHCWDSQGPMPLDEQECAGICNCRSSDEVEALRYVLGRFFVRMVDGHYNGRMAREVEKARGLVATRRSAGSRGAVARWTQPGQAGEMANAWQMHGKCMANAMHLPSKPRDNPKPEPAPASATEGKPASAPAKPADVDAQVWSDWLRLRREKRASVTPTVMRGAIREAEKAGITLNRFLELWVEYGWQGLTAARIKPEDLPARTSPTRPSEPAWRAEQRARNEGFAGPFSARAQAARTQALPETNEVPHGTTPRLV